jgi:peptidyl-dipeptidase Dcp
MNISWSKTLLSVVMAASVFSHASQASNLDSQNPFLHPSTLPYQAPPFDKIRNEDYQPALEEGMKQHLAEVIAIANNPEKPTFENTLVALEKSGELLTRVSRVFFSITSANNNPTLQKVQEVIAPKLAAHEDAIYLNSQLFQRVKAIYQQRDTLSLDPESSRLLDYYYHKFIRAGANLSDTDKTKLKALNQEDATLSAQFVNKLLEGTKAAALVIDNPSELAGLTEGEIATAAADAKARGLEGKWLIPLQNTTQQPALQSLSNRAVRERLFNASWTRTERGDSNDTREIIQRLAKLRAEKAALLGFDSFAAWTLQDQMAKTPEAVLSLLKKLAPATTAKAKEEAADIQAMIKQQGESFQLAPWDWAYYAEKVRKARYDLDENEVKPYFELNRVLTDGVFYAANKLYGITVKERHDIPVYHPDVRVFELFNEDGSTIGLFYADLFKRDNKGGGAWMDNLVGQSYLLGTKPVIYNVTNFTKPAAGQPALISWDDVTTLFHEFGHALHGFFADQQYPSLSGTNTARDFVEFPSQFNEHWASYPEVFNHYAKHYKTGQPMPKALVKKLRDAAHFNQGFALTELLAAADLDMAWHSLSAKAPLQPVDKFEVNALKEAGLYLPQVPPRYRSSYFMHIWGNGYSAGYYAYLWTEMLDDDAYTWFEENGGLTRKNGDRFRKMILSRGNTLDYAEMFRAFRGRDPQIEPMLKNRGLIQ